jgi:hypothetical protein
MTAALQGCLLTRSLGGVIWTWPCLPLTASQPRCLRLNALLLPTACQGMARSQGSKPEPARASCLCSESDINHSNQVPKVTVARWHSAPEDRRNGGFRLRDDLITQTVPLLLHPFQSDQNLCRCSRSCILFDAKMQGRSGAEHVAHSTIAREPSNKDKVRRFIGTCTRLRCPWFSHSRVRPLHLARSPPS